MFQLTLLDSSDPLGEEHVPGSHWSKENEEICGIDLNPTSSLESSLTDSCQAWQSHIQPIDQ